MQFMSNKFLYYIPIILNYKKAYLEKLFFKFPLVPPSMFLIFGSKIPMYFDYSFWRQIFIVGPINLKSIPKIL